MHCGNWRRLQPTLDWRHGRVHNRARKRACEARVAGMTANWSIRHLVCQAYGCELAVMWRADGRWTWIVSVAGERIAGGISQSMEGAKDAADAAANRHARNDGTVQLTMF